MTDGSRPRDENELRPSTNQRRSMTAGQDRPTGMNGDSPQYSDSRHMEMDADTVMGNRCVCAVPHSMEMETYKVLRTQVQQRMAENGWSVLMVTSARPGEGKTLTAINLAFTFAVAYSQTALLLDCDLRRQDVHKCLGLDSRLGLVDHILDDVPIRDVMVWPGVDKLTVISGARTVQESTEFLGSPKMKALVEEMKSRYPDRYLIIDTPPVLAGADAITFAPFVDCILMVVETGRTSIQDVQRAVEMLPRDKVLGFVMNRHKKKRGDGAYQYPRRP